MRPSPTAYEVSDQRCIAPRLPNTTHCTGDRSQDAGDTLYPGGHHNPRPTVHTLPLALLSIDPNLAVSSRTDGDFPARFGRDENRLTELLSDVLTKLLAFRYPSLNEDTIHASCGRPRLGSTHGRWHTHPRERCVTPTSYPSKQHGPLSRLIFFVTPRVGSVQEMCRFVHHVTATLCSSFRLHLPV